MIRTWVASIAPLYEESCYNLCYGQAPVFRREKADRMKGKQARAQSIGVWTLYERMKKEYGIPEDAAYNFSHSGDYVLCSVHIGQSAQEPRVGCDIEQMGRADLKIARRFFCPAEYGRIAREKDERQRDTLFYRYWVLKESFMKATREGLSLGMDTFEIALGNPPVLTSQPQNFPESYFYIEAGLEEGKLVQNRAEGRRLVCEKYGKEKREDRYRIAVCSTDASIKQIIQVHIEG